MFRFIKYDETGYTDFENSIFSNLNQSKFDRLNDKITIEDIDYRISSIKELCDNCNNTETLNYETMTARPAHRIITTPGAKGTIPATNDHTDSSWSATDLYNGEVLINTTDNMAYIRSGNEIRSWQLNPIVVNPPIAFEFIEPESLTVGSLPVQVMFYGNGLNQIMEVDYDMIEYGITVSDFQILGQEQISLIIDPSLANIGGSPAESLIIPFISTSGEKIQAYLTLSAAEIPIGNPVITNILPFGNDFFIPGEQVVIIIGNELNSRDGLSINTKNDLITQYGYEFDSENNILAHIYIPQEVLNSDQTFELSYDGYLSEPFTVFLFSENQSPVTSITSITREGGDGFIPGEQQIRISGNNLIRTPIELSEVYASHQAIIINGINVMEDYFLVDVTIGAELIGTELNFMLAYQDGFMTDWFSVVLS